MITKLEIEAFLAVAQYGSVSAAAESLFITQPALSRRIRCIEDELECPLFVRGKGMRGVTLTVQGEAFMPVAHRWLDVYGEALAVKDVQSKPRLRISAVGSVRSFLLPGILREATQDNQPYLISFNLCHSAEASGLVQSGDTDVALIDLVRNQSLVNEAVVATPVYSVPFVLVGGPFWAGCGPVCPERMNPRREIRLPWNYSFDVWHESHFDTGSAAFVRLDNAATIEYVLRDDLFCIVPKTEALRLSRVNSELVVADLVDAPPDEIIHCLTPASAQKSERLSYFMDLLKRHVNSAPGIHSFLS